MFGGLHIEIALWNTLGDLLYGSGWTTALCEAGVASSGTADSFLKAAHLTKTRHAHQVTFLAFSQLQEKAYLCHTDNNDVPFEIWKENMIKRSPTFQLWTIILEFERIVLFFIRAHRTRDFNLYVKCLDALTPWFFALDHTNTPAGSQFTSGI